MMRNKKEEYIYPKWGEEYSFRSYPPKFDKQFENLLPDPNNFEQGQYTRISTYTNVGFYSVPGTFQTISYRTFRKFSLSYRKDNKYICIQDWEQID
jgi:hypothetical protein